MYARRVADRELTFDFADGLLENNLLLVDRETNSVWSQLHGKAMMGELEGQPLTVVPSMQTTWRFWKERHPDTRVVVLPGRSGRPYHYRNRPPSLPSPKMPRKEHDVSALGLGLALGGQALWVSLGELDRRGTPLTIELGGQSVTLHHDENALTAWAENERGELLPGVLAYEAGWNAFHPDSRGLP